MNLLQKYRTWKARKKNTETRRVTSGRLDPSARAAEFARRRGTE
jgi:hypothetical protein